MQFNQQVKLNLWLVCSCGLAQSSHDTEFKWFNVSFKALSGILIPFAGTWCSIKSAEGQQNQTYQLNYSCILKDSART